MPVIEVEAATLRRRRAARVLVINSTGAVLLFKYSHEGSVVDDALAEKGSYYTTPGGGVRAHETFMEGAVRELFEETGLTTAIPPRIVATRQAPLLLDSGDIVLADEQYFAVRVATNCVLDTSNWSPTERRNIKDTLWSTPADLKHLKTQGLWPLELGEILASAISAEPNPIPLEYVSTREQIGSTVIHVDYSDPSPGPAA